MTRFKATCAYDGTDFVGWQSQPNGVAIQDIIERRIESIFKTPIRIHSSGRTDAGVHARQQVFHFDAEWSHTDAELLRAFKSNLPETIQITKLKRVSPHFHARFSATNKRYVYTIHTGWADPMDTRFTWSLGRELNTNAMRDAAARLTGVHDFRAYSTRRNDGSDETLDPVRHLSKLDLTVRGPHIKIAAEADGFLYKMVRSLVGALVEVGLGRLSPEQITHILESGARGNTVPSAPARGLCLEKVAYKRRATSETHAATASLHKLADGSEHIDLFLDTGAPKLTTYEINADAWGSLQTGQIAAIAQKADHRHHYLSFEGALSENRGSVSVVWQGHWRLHSQDAILPETGKISLNNGRLIISDA